MGSQFICATNPSTCHQRPQEKLPRLQEKPPRLLPRVTGTGGMTGTGDWIDRGVEQWIALHLVGASGAEAVIEGLVVIREAPDKGDLREQVEEDRGEIEVRRKGNFFSLCATESSSR